MSNGNITAFTLSKTKENSLLFYQQRIFDSIQEYQHPESQNVKIGNLRNAVFQLEANRDESTLNSPEDIASRKQRMYIDTQIGEQVAARVNEGIAELDTKTTLKLTSDKAKFLTLDKLKEKSSFFETILSKIPKKQSLPRLPSQSTPMRIDSESAQGSAVHPNQPNQPSVRRYTRTPAMHSATISNGSNPPYNSNRFLTNDEKRSISHNIEQEDERPTKSPFVSAGNVLRQNKHRKNGGGESMTSNGNYAPNRNENDDDNEDENHASWGVYGTSKTNGGYHPVTSLNAPQKKKKSGRRTFVPPLKSNKEKRKREGETADEAQPPKKRKKPTGGNNKDGKSNILEELFPDGEIPERMKNLDPNMIEMICNEILDHGKPVRWDDIAGLRHAKRSVVEMVVWPLQRPDLFCGLRDPPKGLLLFGPPGTGKTLIGKAIAYESGATFFNISASSLLSKWIGEGEKMVRTLFAVASHFEPAVIFIDEIDSLLSARSEGEQEASRRIKTEFLVQLDGAGTDDTERILVIGATNRPQEIDEAARRRLVKKLYIPLPDEEARRELVATLLKKEKHNIGNEELEQIVKRSEGYSGADIKALCTESALGPLRDISNITEISAESVRPIMIKDFDDAFQQIRASVNQEDLDHYIEWNKKFGSSK